MACTAVHGATLVLLKQALGHDEAQHLPAGRVDHEVLDLPDLLPAFAHHTDRPITSLAFCTAHLLAR